MKFVPLVQVNVDQNLSTCFLDSWSKRKYKKDSDAVTRSVSFGWSMFLLCAGILYEAKHIYIPGSYIKQRIISLSLIYCYF